MFEPMPVKVAVMVPGPLIVAVVEAEFAFARIMVWGLDHAVNV